jgi:hypothetical protein
VRVTDDQPAAIKARVLRDQPPHTVEVLQDLLGALKHKLARRRQPHKSMRSDEQSNPELLLERLNLLAHGRLADSQHFARSCETPAANHGAKGLQQLRVDLD